MRNLLGHWTFFKFWENFRLRLEGIIKNGLRRTRRNFGHGGKEKLNWAFLLPCPDSWRHLFLPLWSIWTQTQSFSRSSPVDIRNTAFIQMQILNNKIFWWVFRYYLCILTCSSNIWIRIIGFWLNSFNSPAYRSTKLKIYNSITMARYFRDVPFLTDIIYYNLTIIYSWRHLGALKPVNKKTIIINYDYSKNKQWQSYTELRTLKNKANPLVLGPFLWTLCDNFFRCGIRGRWLLDRAAGA